MTLKPPARGKLTTKTDQTPKWPALHIERKQAAPTSLLTERAGPGICWPSLLIGQYSLNSQKTQQGLSPQHSLVFLRKPK